jgi:hypothetical protein
LAETPAAVGGSAVFCVDAYPDLTNCTIVDNPVHNEDAFYATAAIHNHISKSRPVNSVIRDNDSSYFLGGQILEGKRFYATYNNIEGGHAGVGNFDADPMFAGEGAHPYTILAGSPCIDAGTPDLGGLAIPTFDLAGSPRVHGGRIDVGAYEWLAATVVGGAVRSPISLTLRNDPNPFNSSTAIMLRADRGGSMRLTLYDSGGRMVRRLLDGVATAGREPVIWDGRDDRGSMLPSGIYFARVNLDGEMRTLKIVLTR